MSDPDKCFVRPKVRFSKSAESPEELNIDRAFGRPTIRSVTDFPSRVKILKAPLVNAEFEQSSSSEEHATGRSAVDAPNNKHPLKLSYPSTSCVTKIHPTSKNLTSDLRSSFEGRESPTNLRSPSNPAKTLKNVSVDEKSSSAKGERSSNLRVTKKSSSLPEKIPKSTNNDRRSLRNFSKTHAIGKENVAANGESRENVLKVPENTPRSEITAKSTISRNTQKIADKSSKTEVTRKLAETAGKTSAGARKMIKQKSPAESSIKSIAGKSIKPKPTSVGLMACMKNTKIRSNSVPMKKTILRDVSAGTSRVHVGPGIPRSRSTELNNPDQKIRSREEIHSGDKLSRPEYNSIVFTMKKLRDARDAKIVDDMEHLPAIYRRLVNGKVSSALDFGANEAIYRDLVDLSIDVKELPARLTRSKDPEPRQRDIDPKLSDFFVPTNDEEYKRGILVRPPSPRIHDTWNPYKISDRIFAWKENLDL